MKRARPVIAIDGPSGVGKSTLAARLALTLHFTKLDTGAMYRALALKALEQDMDFDREAPLVSLAEATDITLEPSTHATRVLLDTRDVTLRLRDADVTQAASRISVHAGVRRWMVTHQRAMGEQGGVVMEGRDIGTVVFPDAEVKFFLDATEEVRGERRFRQEARNLQTSPIEQFAQEEVRRRLHERDARDRNREASPLVAAADAVHLDTTALNADEALARSLEVIGSRFPELAARSAH